MDSPQLSPRYSGYQNTYSGVNAENNVLNMGTSDLPLVPHRNFGNDGPFATPEEFKIRAKSYKRSQIKRSILKSLIIFGILLVLAIVALGSVGWALNKRYTGRALPYTYVGEISIGGLTATEVKSALDKKASETMVTFTDGGLTRQVPVKEFTANFDTEKTAKDALVGFNPFSFLKPRNLEVPVTVNASQVDGYLRLQVADKQTKSVNAEIVKNKSDLAIKPEVTGYRTSTEYVVQQLELQLKELKDPVISLSASTEKPKITSEDLKNDIETAKKMLATNVGVQIWNAKVTPTQEQKLSWLEVKENSGSSDADLQFSKAKVREYIFALAEKYNTQKEDETLGTNSDGTKSVKPGKKGQKVKNIDDVFSKYYTALTSQQNGTFAFEFDQEDYNKVANTPINTPQPTTTQQTNNNNNNPQPATQNLPTNTTPASSDSQNTP